MVVINRYKKPTYADKININKYLQKSKWKGGGKRKTKDGDENNKDVTSEKKKKVSLYMQFGNLQNDARGLLYCYGATNPSPKVALWAFWILIRCPQKYKYTSKHEQNFLNYSQVFIFF